MKLNVLKNWIGGKPIFEEDSLIPSDLESRLGTFHTDGLRQNMKRFNWKKRCNTSHCFVGSKSIYKDGVELISSIPFLVPRRNESDRTVFLEKTDEDIDSILDAYFSEESDLLKKGKILVQAGHFIPDLNNLRDGSLQSIKGLEEGLRFIKKIYEKGGSADLMLYSNDLRMMKGGIGEETRNSFYDNLVLPEAYVSLVKRYSEEIEKITQEQNRDYNFELFFSGEKRLYNRSLKEAKKLVKSGMVEKKDRQYVTKSGVVVADISSGEHVSQIKCDSACMRLNMLANEMGYISIVNFFPTCAKKGVESRSMKAFYDLNPDSAIEIFNVYKTYTCWVDKESKFIMDHEVKR